MDGPRLILNSDDPASPVVDPHPPRIAVVGDIMLDIDLHCSCTRICQEGPWPVFSIERVEQRLGGAGNVAVMLDALGARTMLVGCVGQDDVDSLTRVGDFAGWQTLPGATTTKTRLWVGGRLMGPRIDRDLSTACSDDLADPFLETLTRFHPQAIVVADHGKGVVTSQLMRQLGHLGVPVYVDPVQQTPLPLIPLAVAGGPHELGPDASRAECLIEKRGPRGLRWMTAESSGELSSACRNLIDPLGAGDQFIATLAWLRSLGQDWPTAIAGANLAAGMQCERPGCIPVTSTELRVRLGAGLPTPPKRPTEGLLFQ
ncbi:MAG: hypothetical protein JSS49_29685 [Planctomycetes bacterium]|nr:hypothetical protein [Planctomycetota bacterium]